MTGVFDGTATFGDGEPDETVTQRHCGQRDAFVAKYARDGTLLWATSAGGHASAHSFGIATDPRGNSYVTGSFGNNSCKSPTVDVRRRGSPRPLSAVPDAVTSSSPSTTETATCFGPFPQAAPAATHGARHRDDPPGNSYVTGHFRGHRDVWRGRGNAIVPQHCSRGCRALHVRRQVRSRRRPALGDQRRWLRSTAPRERHRDRPRGNSYVTGSFGPARRRLAKGERRRPPSPVLREH